MKSSLRLALLACASFIGLALAAPALAAYDPSLTIEQSSYKVGAATIADVFIVATAERRPDREADDLLAGRLQRRPDAGTGDEDRLGLRNREGEGARRRAPAALR